MAIVKQGQYTIKMTSLNDEAEGLVSVSDIEWAGKALTLGQEAILQAGNGETIFHGICQYVNYVERKNLINKTYTGLKATTLDGGELIIHLRRKG